MAAGVQLHVVGEEMTVTLFNSDRIEVRRQHTIGVRIEANEDPERNRKLLLRERSADPLTELWKF